jgi:hypothetical protein
MINICMGLTNKDYKQLFNSIHLVEKVNNFGYGFENSELKPLSPMANNGTFIGKVLMDQSIPMKTEMVQALEKIIDSVSNIDYREGESKFALELGKIVKKQVPPHLQGELIGLLSRKLDSKNRDFVFRGYSNIL